TISLLVFSSSDPFITYNTTSASPSHFFFNISYYSPKSIFFTYTTLFRSLSHLFSQCCMLLQAVRCFYRNCCTRLAAVQKHQHLGRTIDSTHLLILNKDDSLAYHVWMLFFCKMF